MDEIKVVKKDGSVEDFDPDKIKRVVSVAGLEEDQAVKLVDELTEWVKRNDAKKITSKSIRKKVVDELEKLDNYAANFYKWYKKSEHKSVD